MAFNPAEAAHKLPADGPEMKTWTADQVRAFLSITTGDRLACLWRLAFATGARRGELLGLRWSDVDLARQVLVIRQQLVRQGQSLGFGPPKTRAGRRSITLDQGAVAALEARRGRRQWDRNGFGAAYRDGDLVFARPDSLPLDPDVVSFSFSRRSTGPGCRGFGSTMPDTPQRLSYLRPGFTPRSSRSGSATPASRSPSIGTPM